MEPISPFSEAICSYKSNLCWPNQQNLLCSSQLRNESSFARKTPLRKSPQWPSVIPRTREIKTEISSPWFSLLFLLYILCNGGWQVDLHFYILLDITASDVLVETLWREDDHKGSDNRQRLTHKNTSIHRKENIDLGRNLLHLWYQSQNKRKKGNFTGFCERLWKD